MKKLMKKKNNKGFSLVELIVVVLILGILAVALAPQVMKWVGTARTNSDKNQAKTYQSTIQGALADWQQYNSIPSDKDAVYKIEDNKLTASQDWAGTNGTGAAYNLSDAIDEYTGKDYKKPQEASYFTVTIEKTSGKVTVSVGDPGTP